MGHMAVLLSLLSPVLISTSPSPPSYSPTVSSHSVLTPPYVTTLPHILNRLQKLFAHLLSDGSTNNQFCTVFPLTTFQSQSARTSLLLYFCNGATRLMQMTAKESLFLLLDLLMCRPVSSNHECNPGKPGLECWFDADCNFFFLICFTFYLSL
ncbi:hypothetical protein AOLI_G00095550 [Acnodon oligacanthus]